MSPSSQTARAKIPAAWVLPVLFALSPSLPTPAATLHVSQSGDGSDGLSWPTAFRTISQAITSTTSGDSVWIRGGTYEERIQMKSGIHLLGRFAGDETIENFEERDTTANRTTLNPNGMEGSVVSMIRIMNATVEELTITGGKAAEGVGVNMVDSRNVVVTKCMISGNSATDELMNPPVGLPFLVGGGISAVRTVFTINDCVISANWATRGGGIYIEEGTGSVRNSAVHDNMLSGIRILDSSLTVECCGLDSNKGAADGGGIHSFRSDLIVRDSTITNNRAPGGSGAGIYSFITRSLEVRNCLVDRNIAHDFSEGGGGIYTRGGTSFPNAKSIIADSTITNNDAGGRGGGIVVDGGETVISGCLIEGNLGGGFGGGGIDLSCFGCDDEVLIADCMIRNNTGNRGGGITSIQYNTFIQDCIISENTTTDHGGGGIQLSQGGSIRGCWITANRCVGLGGGIVAAGLLTRVENTVVSDNTAEFAGGGISDTSLLGQYINCTIVNNSSPLGNEISAGDETRREHFRTIITNCIVYNKSASPIIDGGNPNTQVNYSNVSGGWPGEGNIDADPLFLDAESGDFRLLTSSPCIDSGSTTGPATDIHRNPRPVDVLETGRDGPSAFDMGAYEFQIPKGDLNSNGYFDPLDLFIFQEDWMKATQ